MADMLISLIVGMALAMRVGLYIGLMDRLSLTICRIVKFMTMDGIIYVRKISLTFSTFYLPNSSELMRHLLLK